MLLHELLDHLDDLAVTLTLTETGIRATGPSAAIAALSADLRLHRDLLHAHLVGVGTGHTLAFCEECKAPTITAVKTTAGKSRDTWPTCRDTPGCGGRNQHGTALARHRPRPADLAARTNCPAPPSTPRPPAKVDKRRLLGPRPPWPSPPTTTDRSTQ